MTTILRSLDWMHSTGFGVDDVREWPEKAQEILVESGILRKSSYADSVVCRECDEACSVAVEVEDGENGAPARAFHDCPLRDDIGRTAVPLERLRSWSASMNGLAAWLSLELGCSKEAEVVTADRLWWLGRSCSGTPRSDVFLARGACWQDVRTRFADVGRLTECSSPLVLVPHDVPTDEVFGPLAQCASLARLLQPREDALALDHAEISRICGSQQRAGVLQSPFHHWDDFRGIERNGNRFALSPAQAAAVRVLFEAAENGEPVLSSAALLSRMEELAPVRMSDIFRSDDPRRVLIKRIGRDSYCLNL